MSTLRKLSVIYLLCATWFTVAIALDRDPPLHRASRAALAAAQVALDKHVFNPGVEVTRAGADRLIAALYPPRPAPKSVARAVPHSSSGSMPRRVANAQVPDTKALLPANPSVAAPSLSPPSLPEMHGALNAPVARSSRIVSKVDGTARLALKTPPPSALAPTAAVAESLAPAELVRVTLRLKENLTHEMLENFKLFIYVSKADKGPWSQRLYVFRKDAHDNLSMLYNWPASTGREKYEIAPNGTHQHSITPPGYYQLDPARMYLSHFSGEWHEPMPYAMFFNWEDHGYQTGLAIHGAAGDEVLQLGSRASAGCIRIAPQNAQLLFGMIRAEYKGLAPRFAFDRHTATMSNDGVLMHDVAGNLKMAEGYKVLVFVENYGGENVVAALF